MKNGNRQVRSIVSEKTDGSSPKARKSIRGAPIEIESQGVLGNLFSVKETRILEALHHNFVKATYPRRGILPGDVGDALDAVLLDIVKIEDHAVVDHLADVPEDAGVDYDLSLIECLLVDPVGIGVCHVNAMVSGLFNRCCVIGYKTIE